MKLMYRSFVVKVIMKEGPAACQMDPECVKTEENPTGVPLWKMFDMSVSIPFIFAKINSR